MTKTHLISAANGKSIDDKINEFIKDKKVIDIKYSSVSCPTMFGTGICDRALIIFEE